MPSPSPERSPQADDFSPARWRSPWELDADLPDYGPIPDAPKDVRPAVKKKAERAAPERELPHEFDDIVRAVSSTRSRSMVGVVMLASFAFVSSLILWVLTRDGDPVWDEDLIPKALPSAVTHSAEVPRAAERLRLALDAALAPATDLPVGVAPALWSTPALAKGSEAAAAVVEKVKDLVSETDWDPKHPAWVQRDLGNHENWTNLATACSIAAVYYTRQKQDEAAVSLALDILSLGRRLQSITLLPTYYGRALTLHHVGCMALAHALQNTSLSALDLVKAQSDAEQCAPLDATLQAAMNDYYRFEKGLVAGPLTDDKADVLIAGMMTDRPGQLFFKPNETLELFAASFREIKGDLAKAPYLRADQIMNRIGPRGRPNALPGYPNYAGVKHANDRIWAYVDLMESQSLARARHELVTTMFGIRRYVALKGMAPPNLEALVTEKIFEKLPVDPFTGQPMVYSLGNRVLYSVGFDLKDEGGRPAGAPLEDDAEPSISFGGN